MGYRIDPLVRGDLFLKFKTQTLCLITVMAIIKIITKINSDQKTVFDLSRNIDFHIESAKGTSEKAIDGKTSGLIQLDESVTWEAKHFGIKQQLTTKITHFNSPNFFVDEMTKGIFKSFIHEHHFEKTDNGTKMIDILNYKSPLGFLGKIADFLFLKSYLTHFLRVRNKIIKLHIEKN